MPADLACFGTAAVGSRNDAAQGAATWRSPWRRSPWRRRSKPLRADATRAHSPAGRSAASSHCRGRAARKFRRARGDRNNASAAGVCTSRNRLVPPMTSRPARSSDGIEPTRGPRQPAPRPLDPRRVRERLGADGERRSGYRPRSERGAQPRRHRRRREREAEPQAGEPEEFSERAQHDDVAARRHRRRGSRPAEPTSMKASSTTSMPPRGRSSVASASKASLSRTPAVGIVRIGDDRRDRRRAQSSRSRTASRRVPGERRSARMLGVGRAEHRRAARRHQRGDRGSRICVPGRRHDVRRRRRAISARRGRREPRRLRPDRQAGEEFGRESAAADRDGD